VVNARGAQAKSAPSPAVRGLAIAAAALALNCSHPSPKAPPVPARVWSDTEVLDYALVSREQAAGSRASFETLHSGALGRHNGLILVQTIWQDDVGGGPWPYHFALVVHYKLAKGSDCASVAGVSRSLRVPNGISSAVKQFCVPRVLAEHWPEVARKMAPE